MIATGFFAEHPGPDDRWNGVFRGGSGETLGWNILCCIVISVWHFCLAGVVVSVKCDLSSIMVALG